MSSTRGLHGTITRPAPYAAPLPIVQAVTRAALALRAEYGPLRFVDPCSGDLRIPQALVAAGWHAADIHLGDLGAVPTVLGQLVAGLDLPTVDRPVESRAHHAALLIIAHHADALDAVERSQRAQAIARDLREHADDYAAPLAGRLDLLRAALVGCHFTRLDVREHARSAFADPGAIVWINPPLLNEPGLAGWDPEQHLRPLWDAALRAAAHVLGAAIDSPPGVPFASCQIGGVGGVFHAWSNRPLPSSVAPTVGSTRPGNAAQMAAIAAPFYHDNTPWTTIRAIPVLRDQALYLGRLLGWAPPAPRRGIAGAAAVLLDGALAAVIGYTPPMPRSKYPDVMTASLAMPPTAGSQRDAADLWAASRDAIEAAVQSVSTPERATALRHAQRVRIGTHGEPLTIKEDDLSA